VPPFRIHVMLNLRNAMERCDVSLLAVSSLVAATTDLLRPAGLPGLLAALLADGPPHRPVTVDG